MRTDYLNGLDEVGEGPHETACIRMQSRLHGKVLVGLLVFLVFPSLGRGRACRCRLDQPVAAGGDFARRFFLHMRSAH